MSALTMITKHMTYIYMYVASATDVLMNGTLCEDLFELLQEIGLATPI